MTFSVQYDFRVLDRFSRPVAAMRQKTEALKRTLTRLDKVSSGLNLKIAENVKQFDAIQTPIRQASNLSNTLAVDAKRAARSLEHISGAANRAGEAIKRSSARASVAAGGYRKLGRRVKDAGENLSSIQGVATVAAGITGAVQLVRASVAIEDALADVARVTSFSSSELAAFRGELERMSVGVARPAAGLARIAFEGGKLGIAKADLIGFTNEVVRMAIAFDMTEEEAGASIGSIKAKLGLTMPQVTDLADRMNYLADNTSAAGNRMIEIIARTSGSFKTLRMPPEAAAGLAAFADQLETSPELAASGINMMMARMMKMPGMMKRLLNDPLETIRATLGKLADAPEAKRAGMIFKMFGEESGRFVLKATSSMKLLDATMEKAMSTKAVGSMAREMQNRAARTSFLFAQAMVRMQNAASRLGDVLKPIGTSFANAFSVAMDAVKEFVQAHPGVTKFGAVIAGTSVILATLTVAAGTVAVAIGGMMLAAGPVTAAISTLGGVTAALALPFTAVAAGVAYVVSAFRQWAASNHPVTAGLRETWVLITDVWSEIKLLAAVIFEASGMSEHMSSAVAILRDSFDKFGFIVQVALAPVKLFLSTLKFAIATITDLSTFNFESAFDGLRVFIDEIVGSVLGAVEAVKGLFGLGTSLRKVRETVSGFISSAFKAGREKLFGQPPGVTIPTIPAPTVNVTIPSAPAAPAAPVVPAQAPEPQRIAGTTPGVNVGGTIRVQAEPGTRVTSAIPDLNLGGNVGFAYS